MVKKKKKGDISRYCFIAFYSSVFEPVWQSIKMCCQFFIGDIRVFAASIYFKLYILSKWYVFCKSYVKLCISSLRKGEIHALLENSSKDIVTVGILGIGPDIKGCFQEIGFEKKEWKICSTAYIADYRKT